MTVEGVVLAAGCSSRTKPDCKLALMLDGQTILERSVKSMQPFCSRVFVVTGAYRDLIEDNVNRLQGVVPIYNPDFATGMYGSVKIGLRATAADKVLILPGDCSFIASEVYTSLLAAEGDIVLPEYRKLTGHPVLLSRPIVLELLRDDRYESLQQFIAAHMHKRVAVDDAGILRDIDTPEEYQQALWKLAKKDEGR